MVLCGGVFVVWLFVGVCLGLMVKGGYTMFCLLLFVLGGFWGLGLVLGFDGEMVWFGVGLCDFWCVSWGLGCWMGLV